MNISAENYLSDIAIYLKNLVELMEKARPTAIRFGFDETHMSNRGWINLSLDYIKYATKSMEHQNYLFSGEKRKKMTPLDP